MKTLIAVLSLSLPLVSFLLPAYAQEKKEPSAAQKKQQERMASCNKQAGSKGMKGDERKAFMSDCLKADGKGASPAQAAQQEKMKGCNAQASKKDMKGDERQAFMKKCLSG